MRNRRKREWRPALEAAELWTLPPKGQPVTVPCPRPYNLRHSFAAGASQPVSRHTPLARYMGTSLRMIDLTYGHLVRGSEDAASARLDAFRSRTTEAVEGGKQ